MYNFIFDLQHLADAGTLVNATQNYVNAYTGDTESHSAMSATLKTYYDTELLENARPQLFFSQFGKKQGLPRNHGRTVEWRKFNTLPNAAELVEGVIPTGEKLGVTAMTVPLAQYGMYVAVTDILDLHAVDNIILGATEELGASMGNTQDILVRDKLMEGTSVIYADILADDGTATKVESRSALTSKAILTPTIVNRAATFLKKMKAPTINGKYVGIVHPSVTYDIRQSPEWIEVHKYANTREIYNGEIGELHGVRFVETTNAPVVEGGADGVVYATMIFGKDAFGVIDPDGGAAQMITKSRGEIGGPLEQFSTVGYKFETAVKILYEERMVRVESGSFYSAEDEAN